MSKTWIWLSLLMIPLYGFWIIPQSQAVTINQQAVDTLKQEDATNKKRIQQLKDVDALLAQEKYQGVLEQIPSTLEQETLILLLQKITESAGFVFEGISFVRSQNASVGADTLEAKFSVKGRKDRFFKFLQTVEKSPRFMGIESFAYNVEKINNVEVVSLSIPLYTFAQSSEN